MCVGVVGVGVCGRIQYVYCRLVEGRHCTYVHEMNVV